MSGLDFGVVFNAADSAHADHFGNGVAISGDGLVIAVGTQAFGGSSTAGSVYVFDRDPVTGQITQRGARFGGTGSTRYFGYALALNYDGTVLVVGEPQRYQDSTTYAGAVYTYDWNGSAWVLRDGPWNPFAQISAQFGRSVALTPDGNTLVVGRSFELKNPAQPGEVDVYDRDGSAWVQRGSTIVGGIAGGIFGEAVAISADGNLLAVGEPKWTDGTYATEGRVHIYSRNGDGWDAASIARHPAPHANLWFGQGVGFADNGAVLFAGAWEEHGANNQDQGKVHVFDWVTDTWVARTPPLDPGGSTLDEFGWDLGVTNDGQFLVVSAVNWNDGVYTTGAVFTYAGSGQNLLTGDAPIFVRQLSDDMLDGPISVLRQNAPDAPGFLSVARLDNLFNGAWVKVARHVLAAGTGPIAVQRAAYSAAAPIRVNRAIQPNAPAPVYVARLDQTAVQSSALTWQPRVTIGGVDQTARITGPIDIDRETNASALAEMTLLPDQGALDATEYLRQPLAIHWVPAVGGTPLFGAGGVLLYTGEVERAIWDASRRVIRITASSQLQRQADAMSNDQIAALVGGHWSPVIFEQSSGYQYLVDRLSTRRADVYHDAMGLLRVAAWGAKETADWSFGAGDVIDGSVDYQPADVSQTINRVRMTIQYRFPRLRHREVRIRCSWTKGWCDFLTAPFTLPTKAMFDSAARAMSPWVLQGDVQFYDVPPPQVFICSFNPYVWGGGTLPGGLSYVNTAIPELCRGATWKVARRWAQTVTENHVIELQAPDSIAAHGEFGWQEQFALESTVDGGAWASSLGYQDAPDGARILPGSGDAYVDGTDATDGDAATRADLEEAQVCAQAVGDSLIAGSHRRATVRFATALQPVVEIGDTVDLAAPGMTATGQVVRLRHRLSTDAEAPDCRTDIELALSRTDAGNVAVQDPLDPLPEIAPQEEPPYKRIIYLPWRIGGTVTADKYDSSWAGFTTNYGFDPDNRHPFSTDPNAPQTRVYPVQMVAEAPDIDAAYTDPVEEYQTATRVVAIPNDALEITA